MKARKTAADESKPDEPAFVKSWGQKKSQPEPPPAEPAEDVSHSYCPCTNHLKSLPSRIS